MTPDELENLKTELEEMFFLGYHLGMSAKFAMKLSAEDRKWLIQKTIERKKRDKRGD